MPVKIFSAALVGLDAQIVEAEIEASWGLRCFNIVGLPDKTIQESKERIGAAINSSKLKSPLSQPARVLVNLAPAGLKKEGSLYDLPIALGYLLASGQAKFDPAGKMILGELSLRGDLRPIKGALIAASKALSCGLKEIILPKANEEEAALVKGLRVIGIGTLEEALAYLEGRIQIEPAASFSEKDLSGPSGQNQNQIDLNWIQGQESAKRSLEIAAAGGHNLLMEGPPGTGKTLLAKALASILPPLDLDEIIELAKIYSASGLLTQENRPGLGIRPFRSPHHTASGAALIGGGSPLLPGEITLAHRGVLFLDEFPEFHRDVLESLRQPLEEGSITILRSNARIRLPARFTLVAAANPCPCGNYGNPDKPCSCSPGQVLKYQRKLSGPIIDRIDLFINVPQIKFDKLTAKEGEGQSSSAKSRVGQARAVQKERFKNKPGRLTNSEMTAPEIEEYCKVGESSKEVLKQMVNSGRLSARSYHKVLKVSRTIADLEGSEVIKNSHLMEALMYRQRS
ncbi:MAG: YifB family Mg chelatase-like AAA ATPase [Candidatus Paceibacterota bacterium]|jgi:magnesium chelatase family protein